MKMEDVNRWLALAANLGVLIGILLVAVELRQNGQLTKAQTRNEIAVQIVDLLSLVSTDPTMANLLIRAEAGESLSPTEAVQFRYRALAMFRYFENVHYQFRVGLYDAEEFSKQQSAWRRFMAWPAYVEQWCASRETFSSEFVEDFDKLIEAPGC